MSSFAELHVPQTSEVELYVGGIGGTPIRVDDGFVVVDGSVTTDKLVDESVTTEKIADGAVENSKLANGVVTTIKMADNAVTTTKVADGSITYDKVSEHFTDDLRDNMLGIAGLDLIEALFNE